MPLLAASHPVGVVCLRLQVCVLRRGMLYIQLPARLPGRQGLQAWALVHHSVCRRDSRPDVMTMTITE